MRLASHAICECNWEEHARAIHFSFEKRKHSNHSIHFIYQFVSFISSQFYSFCLISFSSFLFHSFMNSFGFIAIYSFGSVLFVRVGFIRSGRFYSFGSVLFVRVDFIHSARIQQDRNNSVPSISSTLFIYVTETVT